MIALDVMGGDFAPNAIVQGALLAAKEHIPLLLCGPQELIEHKLDQLDQAWRSYPITVLDAPDTIGMGDEPVRAVRSKPASSLVKAVSAVRDGQCTAVVSAGSSGAFMTAALLILGRSQGIERPAIAGLIPSLQGEVLMLDLGANTDCRAIHLEQFAHLGALFMEQWLHKKQPRIALLANGHEEGKGSLIVKEAHQLLKQSTLNFIGNVEPDMIMRNDADVVVCDGFAGNVFLKSVEATCHLFDTWIDAFVTSSHKSQVQSTALAQWGHQLTASIEQRLTFKQRGGAMLLGVNGTVVVCHGNSDARTIRNALAFAYNAVQDRNVHASKTCSQASL